MSLKLFLSTITSPFSTFIPFILENQLSTIASTSSSSMLNPNTVTSLICNFISDDFVIDGIILTSIGVLNVFNNLYLAPIIILSFSILISTSFISLFLVVFK